jgi:hypothetical protein
VERYYRSYSRQGLACHHARNIADKTGRPFGRAAAKFVSAPEAYRVSCELNDTYRKRRQLFLRDDRKRSCRSHTTQASALHRHARHVLREYSYEHDSRTPLRAVERSGVSSSNAFASDTKPTASHGAAQASSAHDGKLEHRITPFESRGGIFKVYVRNLRLAFHRKICKTSESPQRHRWPQSG